MERELAFSCFNELNVKIKVRKVKKKHCSNIGCSPSVTVTKRANFAGMQAKKSDDNRIILAPSMNREYST